MKISLRGLNLIKEFEGYRGFIYDDNGNPCIGWGCNLGLVEEEKYKKYNAKNEIPLFEAEILLSRKVAVAEHGVLVACKNVTLHQNEFDALVSLCFNIGAYALLHGSKNAPQKQISSLVKAFNTGDKAGAADHFLDFKRSLGKVSASLLARRTKERELFLEKESI